ncbi:hypothetical protein [Aminobacter sp. HY435]|uniref:hypothetical protein n=1 Tax=Aminobacter sp. HY435 TaxID=2970917 RepID=UPI0022B9868F|nr:hypothetical protein [Aminobacter sp. HY435]
MQLHVTVEPKPGSEEAFSELCRELGAKPVFLKNRTLGGVLVTEWLTSSTASLHGSPGALLHHTAFVFAVSGFTVTRMKIEATPWHPEAPTKRNGLAILAGRYFEAHVKVLGKLSTDRYAELVRVANVHGAGVSSREDGTRHYVTLRVTEGVLEDFQWAAMQLAERLHKDHFDINPSVSTEFCIFDSNVGHDREWLG